MNSNLSEVDQADAPKPRHTKDRRKNTFHALLHGSLQPRRRGARRDGEQSLVSTDWHHPQWLAVAILTLLMCVGDALLTLTLLQRGAYEANPVMAPLVRDTPLSFAIIKFGLTAGGIVILILLARARLFGAIRVSFILYLVLLSYAGLIAYEFWMLGNLAETV